MLFCPVFLCCAKHVLPVDAIKDFERVLKIGGAKTNA